MTPPEHLLLVNANTTVAVTARLAERAAQFLGNQWRVLAETAPFGPAYIASRAEAAVASHAVLATIEAQVAQARRIDACVIACFGEPGIGAAREAFPFPIVGMAEASVVSALQLSRRFGIVTVGRRWPAMLDDYLRSIGLRDRCAGIVAVPGRALDVLEGSRAMRERLAAAIRRLVDDDGAEAVIVGGAALAGIAAELQPDSPVPLIDSLDAALAQAGALAALRAAGGPSVQAMSSDPAQRSAELALPP